MPHIDVKEIDKVVNSALANIKGHFRSNNGKSGWHQYLGSEKTGVIATAQALLILSYCNEDFDNKHLAYSFLKQSQKKGEDILMRGGWAYVTNFSELPTTECTCWAILALQDRFPNSLEVKSGIDWLMANYPQSIADSGWGTLASDVSRVYSTCLALRVLSKYGLKDSAEFQKALNWLIKVQNTDMGWGERFGHVSTVFHTSFVINTLIDILNKDSVVIKNGMKWLTINLNLHNGNQDVNLGTQEIVDFGYTVGGDTKNKRLIYFHTPLAHAIVALIKTGNLFNQSGFLLLQDVIRNNNDGYWRHPHFVDSVNKPMWLIYDMVVALKTFAQGVPNWQKSKRIKLKNGKLSIVSAVSPFSWAIFSRRFLFGIWGKMFAIFLACVFVIFAYDWFPNWTAKNYTSIILLPLIVELLGYYLTEIKKGN